MNYCPLQGIFAMFIEDVCRNLTRQVMEMYGCVFLLPQHKGRSYASTST